MSRQQTTTGAALNTVFRQQWMPCRYKGFVSRHIELTKDSRNFSSDAQIIFSKQTTMAELDSILEDHAASGEDTKDKVLGVSFMVVNENGE